MLDVWQDPKHDADYLYQSSFKNFADANLVHIQHYYNFAYFKLAYFILTPMKMCWEK